MAETVTTTGLIQAMPSLLVSLAGILVALWLRRKHPVVSGLTVAALATRIVISIASIAFSHHMFTQMDRGADPTTLGIYSGLFNFFSSILGAAALALLIVAVFMGRSKASDAASRCS